MRRRKGSLELRRAMDSSQEHATLLALCREREIELRLQLIDDLGFIQCDKWVEKIPPSLDEESER